MKSHQNIDQRAIALAQHIVARIDRDPQRDGLKKARLTCRHWQRILTGREKACADEWALILEKPWQEVRSILLDSGSEAIRLRQNNPFCGVLSNQERWKIMKEFYQYDTRAA